MGSRYLKVGIVSGLLIASTLVRNAVAQDVLLTFAGFLALLLFSQKRMTAYLLVAFFFRVSLIVLNNFVVELPEVRGSDAGMFEKTGAMWAENGITWLLRNFTSGAFMYSWFIAFVYSIFGRNPFIVQLANSFLGIMTGIFVYKIAKTLWNEEKAVLPAVIALFFPSLVYSSVLTVREIPIIFTLVCGVYLFLVWTESRNLLILGFSVAMFMISYGFHTAIICTLFISMAIVCVDLAKHIRLTSRVDILKDLFGIVLIVVAFFIIFETGYGLEKLGSLTSTPSIPSDLSISRKAILYIKDVFSRVFARLAEMQKTAARDRAAYLEDLQTRNFIDLLWQTPIRVVYFLFSPFLFNCRSFLDLVGLLDAMAIAVLAVGILLGFKSMVRRDLGSYVLLFVIAGVLVFAITVSNYGTAVRHRAKFVPLMLALSAGFLNRQISSFVHRKHHEKS